VNDTIYGVADIKVKFLQTANTFSLDLKNTDGSGKGMKTGKVTDKNIKKITPAGEKIILDLFNEYKTGDSATFIISYSGVPDDGLIIGKTKYGKRGFFGDNWPNRGHHWIPCHEDPADKATVEFIVTAPEHYQVVANGIQVEESSIEDGFKLTHWKEETPISTKVMVIGVADFAVNLAGFVNDKIPVYSWVYPENKEKGFYDYAQAKDILPFFINYVGPYGYKKLANVQSKTKFGGLENANTIFYAEGSVNGTRRNESVIAHEIAHQWFGNMATEKSFGHVWLSEGFATYFTILYFENKYGKDTAVKMLKEDREQVIAYSRRSNKAIVDTTETDYMKLLNVNSYQKGGWVLHMLRSELGDSVFHKAIRKYYATYAGSIAGTEDLQKVFENVSGKKLEQFFHQWLYTTGQPELDITWKYDAGKKIIEVDIRQLQKEAFHFPLTLQIKNAAGEISREKLQVNGAAVSIKIAANSKPLSLLADPDTQLLMNSTIKEK
jgi:aminopeptidase N